MTREEVEALIEIVEAACTAFDDSPSPCWYSIPVLGSDLRSLISLARRVPVLEEALRPFAEAADSIDKETPPNLRCPEDMSIGDAVWERDQPIVHDLRRARAALTPTTEEYGRSPGMDALPEAERVRLFRREETSGVIGYGRRKALFMALTDAFAFPDQTDLTPLVEGLHALNASIAPDQTDVAAPPSAQASSPKPEGVEWRPIDSAPRNETQFLGWNAEGEYWEIWNGILFWQALESVGHIPGVSHLREFAQATTLWEPLPYSPAAFNATSAPSPPAPPEITDEVVERFHVLFWNLYNSGKNASTAMRRVLTEFQKSGGVG